MPPHSPLVFPPFRLDAANESLFKQSQPIPLNRKAFLVLRHLVENAGRLVSKDELLDAVWPETHVGEGVLKVAVAEIRKALDDPAASPRFIETAHRRGYRFIGEIESPHGAPVPSPALRAIERESDLARLHAAHARSLDAHRQLVFVTGETGIGKTTLVEAFVDSLAPSGAWVAHGQCLEHFGEGEPYFPVLAAIARLCRQPGRESFLEILRRHAPTWLAQMPSLVSQAGLESLKRETLGAARERMLREIAEAVEALTAQTPLVLVLEDLHWSDFSTVDLIGHLARGREPARLLIIGTFRPAEIIVKQHPLRALKRELQIHNRCSEIPIEFLSLDAVARFLALRFPGPPLPAGLARLLHQRTDGNPLFLVNCVDYLIARSQLLRGPAGWSLAVPLAQIDTGIPDSLQQMIEKQLDRLSPDERRILSVASVAGMEFSTRTLAGGLASSETPAALASLCEDLVRRGQFIRPAKLIQLIDGSLLERYGFTHILYQHVLYHSVPEARRIVLHKRIGEFQEDAYSAHLPEIAAELAVHFEQGRDFPRAVRYLRLSAVTAANRCANREALDHLDHALRLLPHLPPADRFPLEAVLLDERGIIWRAVDDHPAAAAEYQRLIASAQAANRPDWGVRALLKLSAVLFWTDHRRSLETAQRAVDLSSAFPDPGLHLQARGYFASRAIRLQGWTDSLFNDCLAALEAARAARDPGAIGVHLMSCSFFHSYRSQGRLACSLASEGIQIALDTGDAFLYISCLYFQAWALLHLGEWGQALEVLRQGIELSESNGNGTALTVLQMIRARLHAQSFDFAGALDICLETLPNARPGFPRFVTLLMLGEARLGLGDLALAREAFDTILAETEAGPFCLDWIFRLPFRNALAELALASGDTADARRQTRILADLASLPGERTYLALAHRLQARIAHAEGDSTQAASSLAAARAALDGIEAPLAEWRVLATAAQIANSPSLAQQSAAALARLASSLPDAHPLRESLLHHSSPSALAARP